MKRVLVAGKDSYIGTRLGAFCKENDMPCDVRELDVRGDGWRRADLSGYDSVVLVAGIVHQKETKENARLYYEVNRDLAYDVARAVKAAGVPHFVMLSTMSVYGMDEGVVTPDTEPSPRTHYGRSKLEGERLVGSLADDSFRVAILRPPMVYGPGCKGNFNALAAVARRSPVFPAVDNRRSAIYVDNLCAFVLLCVANRWDGVFFPQDEEYMNTSMVAKIIAKANGKRMILSNSLGIAICLGRKRFRIARKAFGSLVYKDTERNDFKYCVVPCREGIGVAGNPRRRSVFSLGSPKALLVATVVQKHIAVFHVPLLRKLKDMAWETAVAARNDYDNQKQCNIPYCDAYYDIPFERNPFNPRNIVAYRMLCRLMRDGNYDVVHVHTPVGALLGRLAARSCRRRDGIKVIYTAHGFHFYDGAPLINWLVFYPVEWFLSRWTDVLITINKEDYRRASDHFHAERTVYIPGVGVDLEKFKPNESRGRRIREELGLGTDDTMLLSVGELNENKNHASVIRAVEGMGLTYVVVGKGEKRDELAELAKERDVDLRLMGFRNDVADFYDAADAYVLPSMREGLNVSLMEAMASGLPVACSAIRGNVDLIDRADGTMFDPTDAGGMRDAIVAALTNRRELGKKNLKVIRPFEVSQVSRLVSAIYSDMLRSDIS